MGAGRRRQGRKAASQPRPASRKRLVGGRRLDPGRHRRNPHRHAAWIAEGAAALARLYQHHRECHEHGAARVPEREAMALGLDGDALDRGRDAGSGQRLPTTEGSQAASNVAGRSGSSPQQRLTRCPCSPSHRRLTSISAATASQCSTKRRDTPVDDVSLVKPLSCTEQFGKRGHVDHWQSAVPPSLSEATHGPWHEMSHGLSNAATFPPKRQMTEEKIIMKAIVVTDKAAGTAGMKLVERPEPQAATNDVVVQVHASGFTWDELTWPSTWTDRLGRDRTPVIPGQELAGVVTALGYGTTGLSGGQRGFGLSDSYRGGTLAEYVAVEARNLAHGAAGAVGSMVTQLAREFGAYVIGTGRAADRQKALDFGAQEFVDLDNDALEHVGGVDLVFDV